ncbi:hypothetical protein ACSSS7_000986 [Eimeria intestinalis]
MLLQSEDCLGSRALAASVAPSDCVEELIAHGATASAFSDVDGWTAFHSAAAAGREEMMLRLLELCHEDAAAAASGNTLLHLIAECAASTRAADAAAKAAALRQPVDWRAKLPGLEGWTPLLGADPTLGTGPFSGGSPLLRAAATGAVCGMLRLDHRRELKERNDMQQQQQQHGQIIPPWGKDSGLLPIHLSCFGAHRSLARLLLQTGSRIDAVTGEQRWTPLHFAAASGSAALAADLCRWSGGKAVDWRDEGWPLQRTPLVIACEQQASARPDLNVVKVLLAFGADPLKAVRITGLSRICFEDFVEEAEQTEETITALHVAVLGGSADFVADLLQVFKLHVECFGARTPPRGPQGDSDANRQATRQSGKARAPPIVLLTEPGGAKGSRWSPVSLAAALAAHALLNEAAQEDHNVQIAKRLDVCAALVGFAAAEAPPDVAAEACGLERVLGVAEEALALNLVLERICLLHPRRRARQHTQAGLLQQDPSPRLHAASEHQLKQLFAAVTNRLLEQAVLRNFAQVTERVLEIGLCDRTHAERALQESASLGRAEICQLLVNAGAATAASAYAGKGPFELLAKAMQQQQNHMLLLLQHRILAAAAAAAAAAVSPAAQGGSRAAGDAAAATLEAAASAAIKSAATSKTEQARASTPRFPGKCGCEGSSDKLTPYPPVHGRSKSFLPARLLKN